MIIQRIGDRQKKKTLPRLKSETKGCVRGKDPMTKLSEVGPNISRKVHLEWRSFKLPKPPGTLCHLISNIVPQNNDDLDLNPLTKSPAPKKKELSETNSPFETMLYVLSGLLDVSEAKDARESMDVEAGSSLELGDSKPWRTIKFLNYRKKQYQQTWTHQN